MGEYTPQFWIRMYLGSISVISLTPNIPPETRFVWDFLYSSQEEGTVRHRDSRTPQRLSSSCVSAVVEVFSCVTGLYLHAE